MEVDRRHWEFFFLFSFFFLRPRLAGMEGAYHVPIMKVDEANILKLLADTRRTRKIGCKQESVSFWGYLIDCLTSCDAMPRPS